MTKEIVIAVLITSTVWVVLLLLLISKHTQKHLQILKNKEIDFEKEKNLILEKIQAEFEKGYEIGIGKPDFLVQVQPYKNTIGKKGFFQNSQEIEIGYIYRLFIKGVPSLDPHIQIVEKIKVSELNEQNVNSAIEKLEAILNKIPSPHVKLAGNVMDFGKIILKNIQSKSKK